jgi:uncharacterized membrane protein YagU involved in acid resistance
MNNPAPVTRHQDSPSRDWTEVGTKVLAGAAAGAVGVWALDRIDWFMWNREKPETRERTIAVRPNGEAPAEALVTRVEQALDQRSDPETHQALGQAVHYAIGITPAIGYALLRDRLPARGVGRGALYGAGLFLVQDELLNAATGLGAKPQDYPWQDHARGLVAHTVYGIVVETALNLLDDYLADRQPEGAGRQS